MCEQMTRCMYICKLICIRRDIFTYLEMYLYLNTGRRVLTYGEMHLHMKTCSHTERHIYICRGYSYMCKYRETFINI